MNNKLNNPYKKNNSASKIIKELLKIKYPINPIRFKEITKIHEEFYREDIDNLKMMNNSFRGELTVIISNQNNSIKKFNEKKIVNKAKKYLKKYSLKDTVDLIFETEKINRKKVYDLCLKIKNEKN